MKNIDIETLHLLLSGIKIFRNDSLPLSTIIVSEDVFELLISNNIIDKDSTVIE